jgi:hypothetical protein
MNSRALHHKHTDKSDIMHMSFAEISQNFVYWGRGPMLS